MPEHQRKDGSNMRTQDLGGQWLFAHSSDGAPFKSSAELKKAGLEILPANVPGNFELDLHAAGLIPDLFFGMNILKLAEYEGQHVYYFRSFAAEPQGECDAELLFEGLDTFAEIHLNGIRIASCDNMLVEQRVPLKEGLLKNGENELFIHIRPALLEALKFDYPPYLGTHRPGYESLYVRKAPHMYGWDIMPRALSAGIWRPVKLLFLPKERIESLYLETLSLSPDREEAELQLNYSAKIPPLPRGRYSVSVEGSCGGSSFSASEPVHFPKAGRLGFRVKKPRLWWPRGSGSPELYEVRVRLLKDGEALDERSFRHGIRTVELKRTSTTSADKPGDFRFRINHEDIFMKGSNWVPLDAFHSRDAGRLDKAMEMAADLDCNILRCWGGNVYESNRFFDLCDELGVCVWQDFAMACASYPLEPDFMRRLADEAALTVRRLRQHPSVILWAGDNECDWLYWRRRTGDSNNNAITRKLLPEILLMEDPGRPFLPSSPYIDEEANASGGEASIPEKHLWGPRDSFKSDYYRQTPCHFVSEIGYHGCPSPESVRKFISPEKLWTWPPEAAAKLPSPFPNDDAQWGDNGEWNLHSTCPVPGFFGANPGCRVKLMAAQARELFGEIPGSLEDFSFASQAVQAEAKKFFIELFRSAKWRRAGIIWWNLLDGWPQFSDAVVDYYFVKKLAYSYIKRSQRHLCLMLKEPENWGQELVACNDAREDMRVSFKVRDIDSGAILLSGEGVAKANSVASLGRIQFSAGWKKFYLIEWEDGLGSGRNHYLAGFPPFDLAQYREWLAKARLFD